MKIIGVTGTTGAGKSSVCAYIAEKYDVTHVDCDVIAHDVLTDEACKSELVASFGEDIAENGSIVRKRLAQKAFSSKKNTNILNKITHKYITAKIKAVIAENEKNGVKGVLLDAAALFESGLDSICDAVMCVCADEDVRLARITARDGITREAALLRMNAQKKQEFYTEKADGVVYNNGDGEAFAEQADRFMEKAL